MPRDLLVKRFFDENEPENNVEQISFDSKCTSPLPAKHVISSSKSYFDGNEENWQNNGNKNKMTDKNIQSGAECVAQGNKNNSNHEKDLFLKFLDKTVENRNIHLKRDTTHWTAQDTLHKSSKKVQKCQNKLNIGNFSALSPIKSEISSNESGMIEESETKQDWEEDISQNGTFLNHLTLSNGGIDSSPLSLSSCTSATILQAYAARLSSDSDYAR